MKKPSFLIILMIGLVLAAVPNLAAAAPLRIMCQGDSITYGMPNFTTVDAYRTDLSRFLDQAGWTFEFINKAHPGLDSIRIDQNIAADLEGSSFDLVLYDIGTNDITFGDSYETSSFYIKKTINTMLAAGVKKVYLAAVQPRFGSLYARQNNLAQVQRQLVADLRREGKPVYLSDQNGYFLSYVNFISWTDNWTSYYLDDGKHPNNAGYLLMAQCWFESLTDSTAASAVTDLKVQLAGYGKLEFTWTAPTDNQRTNRVLRYILKESQEPITADNWERATDVSNISSKYPAAGGVAESFTLSNMVPDRLYYFALKSEDNNGNVSEISNAVHVITTDDNTQPAVTEITFDGNRVRENDYISSRPLIKAVIHDLPALNSSTDTRAVSPLTIRLKIDGQTVTDGTDSSGHYDSWDAGTETLTYQVKTELAAGNHAFKIEAADYNGNVMPVFSLNNLQVVEGTPVIAGQVLNFPNPFNPDNGQTTISYNLTGNTALRMYIFDYGFRPVYKQDFAQNAAGGAAGYNEVTWDGRNQAGQIVPNGVYFCRIMTGTKLLGKVKIVVLR